jgi:hypothetical protein
MVERKEMGERNGKGGGGAGEAQREGGGGGARDIGIEAARVLSSDDVARLSIVAMNVLHRIMNVLHRRRDEGVALQTSRHGVAACIPPPSTRV